MNRESKSDVWIKLVEKGIFVTRIGFFAILGTVIYLVVNGQPVEETMKMAFFITLGFFFPSEVTTEVIKHLLERNRVLTEEIARLRGDGR